MSVPQPPCPSTSTSSQTWDQWRECFLKELVARSELKPRGPSIWTSWMTREKSTPLRSLILTLFQNWSSPCFAPSNGPNRGSRSLVLRMVPNSSPRETSPGSNGITTSTPSLCPWTQPPISPSWPLHQVSRVSHGLFCPPSQCLCQMQRIQIMRTSPMMPQWGPPMQLPTTSLSTQLTQPNQSLLRTQSFLKIKQSSFAFMREWVTAPFIFSSRCPSMAFCLEVQEVQSSSLCQLQTRQVTQEAMENKSWLFFPNWRASHHRASRLCFSWPTQVINSRSNWPSQGMAHTGKAPHRHCLCGLPFWFDLVHITPSDTSEETVSAKEAFEHFAASHDATVKHYHADNGRFADSLFRDHAKEKGQTISFSGVGAHHIPRMARLRRGSETLWNKPGPCFFMLHTGGPKWFLQASGPTHSIILSLSGTKSPPIQMVFHLLPSSCWNMLPILKHGRLAHLPSLQVTHKSLRIIVSQQTSFSPFLDLTIDPAL